MSNLSNKKSRPYNFVRTRYHSRGTTLIHSRLTSAASSATAVSNKHGLPWHVNVCRSVTAYLHPIRTRSVCSSKRYSQSIPSCASHLPAAFCMGVKIATFSFQSLLIFHLFTSLTDLRSFVKIVSTFPLFSAFYSTRFAKSTINGIAISIRSINIRNSFHKFNGISLLTIIVPTSVR